MTNDARIEVKHMGHTFTAAREGDRVTLARDGRHAGVGRWDDEAGIVVEPYVQLLQDTDDSEDVYAELSRALHAASLPS